MNLRRVVIRCCVSFLICGSVAVAQKAQKTQKAAVPRPAPRIALSLDATEAPRKIFHARLTIPAAPGTLTLYYPKWIPGEHGPTGPVQDLTGLAFTAKGQTLKWRRDLVDNWAFHVEVPAGVSSIEAALDFVSPARGGWGMYSGRPLRPTK